MKQRLTLRSVNNTLLILIILINAYVIVAPFTPALTFWYQRHHTHDYRQLTQKLIPGAVAQRATDQANQIIIPAILLDQTIHEGSQMYTELAEGVWRWPQGSTPGKGGNTILIGHRFTYTNPRGVFYELNQVKLGDTIAIIWGGKTYTYDVTDITQVSPSYVAILNQTSQSEVTLYTCTPLVDPRYRLVVVADLEHVS